MLAGWWKQLAPLRPQNLRLGHLLLHRIEAPVTRRTRTPLESLAALVLQAVALQAPATIADLDHLLSIGSPFLLRLLQKLRSLALVETDSAERWLPTSEGRQALADGGYARVEQDRPIFSFVQGELHSHAPQFLPLASHPAAKPWSEAEGSEFDAQVLRACFLQPRSWKLAHGFPPDVELVEAPAGAQKTDAQWQQIILDRPEHLLVAAVQTTDAHRGERLLGFAAQAETWSMDTAVPVIDLGANWREILPDLDVEPPLAQWQHAWRSWCQPRNLPVAEVDACRLERQEYRLRVTTDHRFVERLRAARSDILKNEAWLVAGSGRVRTAARVDLVELGRPAAAAERG